MPPVGSRPLAVLREVVGDRGPREVPPFLFDLFDRRASRSLWQRGTRCASEVGWGHVARDPGGWDPGQSDHRASPGVHFSITNQSIPSHTTIQGEMA